MAVEDEKFREIERRVTAIEMRNQRVEQDKTWERSLVRRLVIATVTFVAAFSYLALIQSQNVLLGAVIPAGAYLISAFSLDFLRKR